MIPQDIPIEVVAEVVAWVKQRHLVHDTAITLGPTDTVGDAIHLLPKRSHGAVIVVDDDGRPMGVVTEADTVGRGPFHPAAARDVDRAAHRAGATRIRVPGSTCSRRAVADSPRWWTPRVGWSGC